MEHKAKVDCLLKDGTFTNEDGKSVDFVQVYITLNGIRIKLKPADATSRDIITDYMNKAASLAK